MDGNDIAKLKKCGTIVTVKKEVPCFAYICDTYISVLDKYPNILLYPIIFIECTYLYPHEVVLSESNKHIHWNHLCPYIQANVDNLFVLIHFSLRYEENEIIDFFEKEKAEKGINNIKIWAGLTE